MELEGWFGARGKTWRKGVFPSSSLGIVWKVDKSQSNSHITNKSEFPNLMPGRPAEILLLCFAAGEAIFSNPSPQELPFDPIFHRSHGLFRPRFRYRS
jgi:hypothetical protein